MDHKEAIIQATIELIEENGKHLEEITVREICKRADVGLGLVNYHFGNKDKLIEQCVERMINGTVERFQRIRQETDGLTPFEKLEYLGNMTLDFLFEHYAVSKISILTDMQTPKDNDNTNRTYTAYLPLVAACRPDLDESGIRRKTFCLITAMQQMFLRYETVSKLMNIDLSEKENRKAWHSQIDPHPVKRTEKRYKIFRLAAHGCQLLFMPQSIMRTFPTESAHPGRAAPAWCCNSGCSQ